MELATSSDVELCFGKIRNQHAQRALPDYRDPFFVTTYAELQRFRNTSMRLRLARRFTSNRAFTPGRSSIKKSLTLIGEPGAEIRGNGSAKW